jgi:hypothetical protein
MNPDEYAALVNFKKRWRNELDVIARVDARCQDLHGRYESIQGRVGRLASRIAEARAMIIYLKGLPASPGRDQQIASARGDLAELEVEMRQLQERFVSIISRSQSQLAVRESVVNAFLARTCPTGILPGGGSISQLLGSSENTLSAGGR